MAAARIGPALLRGAGELREEVKTGEGLNDGAGVSVGGQKNLPEVPALMRVSRSERPAPR